MSKMTSSTATMAEANTDRTGKILTDFSIKTIIEGDQSVSAHCKINPAHHLASKNRRDILIRDLNSKKQKLTIENHQQAQNQTSNQFQTNSTNTQNRKYRPKNFRCPACKMAFSNNGQLKNHVRIHTGERPFRCNQPNCNKTFTRNEELTRHKLIHTGVRPHSCTTCGKRFGRKDHLKKHVRTHDRKRSRKKVFVPARAYIEEDMFVPPKPTRLETAHVSADCDTRLLNVASPPSNLTSLHNTDLTLMPAAATSLPVSSPLDYCQPNHIYHQSCSTLAPPAPSTTTITGPATSAATSAIQQFASDYWYKWYNLLGFYQHQYHQQPPLGGPGGLFRK